MGADGSELETMAILTCGSNRLVSALHDRMPAIVAPEAFDLWLDCKPGTAEHLREFLHPAPEELLDIIEVSPKLNNSRNDGPNVLQPVGTARLL